MEGAADMYTLTNHNKIQAPLDFQNKNHGLESGDSLAWKTLGLGMSSGVLQTENEPTGGLTREGDPPEILPLRLMLGLQHRGEDDERSASD